MTARNCYGRKHALVRKLELSREESPDKALRLVLMFSLRKEHFGEEKRKMLAEVNDLFRSFLFLIRNILLFIENS